MYDKRRNNPPRLQCYVSLPSYTRLFCHAFAKKHLASGAFKVLDNDVYIIFIFPLYRNTKSKV